MDPFHVSIFMWQKSLSPEFRETKRPGFPAGDQKPLQFESWESRQGSAGVDEKHVHVLLVKYS